MAKMNSIFESLFKGNHNNGSSGADGSSQYDTMMSGMTPIFEEPPATYSARHHIVESMYGTVRRIKKHHHRQSVANHLFHHDEGGPQLTLRRNSCVDIGVERLMSANSTNHIYSSNNNNINNNSVDSSVESAPEPLAGHFERSGSTKSNSATKSRGPLSRLWHMRRRSFSQFELTSIGLNQGSKGALGGSSGHLNLLDLNECDTPGVFHPIGDFWGSSCDLEMTQGCNKGGGDSGGGGGVNAEQQSERVNVSASTATDDYGFLPAHRQFDGLITGESGSSKGSKCKKESGGGAPSVLSDCDEEQDPRELHPRIPPPAPNRRVHPGRLSYRRHSENYGNGRSLSPAGAARNPPFSSSEGGNGNNSKRSSKLKRRKAYYRDKKEGRSRSLTHIDNLDPAMLLRNEDMDSKSEPDTSQDLLFVPGPAESRESRRKKLARSQVSSSEFFSVCFEGEGHEEFLPATRGTCLGEALRPLCDKKNIDLASVNVYVDSSKTPLPAAAHTDTYFVAGKNLIVRAKEADPKFHTRSFKQPSRKSSQRGKHKFFSVSTEDASYSGSGAGGNANSDNASLFIGTNSGSPHAWQSSAAGSTQQAPSQQQQQSATGLISHEGSLKVKQAKQTNRWSGLFSNSKDNSKMDLLVEQLDSYRKNGIPKPNILSCEEDDLQLSLCPEEDWQAIVGVTADMSERTRQQQTAIWELVETEVVYLKTIKVITDLFLACLYNLQSANILNEIDRDQLFSNIPDIYKANKTLWLECILPMVQKARESKQPLQPQELRSGFLRFGGMCQPYTRYCLDQTKCQQYCREKYQENEQFKAYLAWCETRKECNRLRLMDILVRPMQRLTKYSLLLKAILRHTEDPEQRRALEEMIASVERFVKSVNGTLRSRQDAERLQAIAERIECYDVVETRDDELESIVKSHSKLDLFHPMPGCRSSKRWLLFEGDLKLKDSFTSKMDVHCFLFTDMLLVCKPMGRKGEKMKVIRQPFVVDRLLCREIAKDSSAFNAVYLNEYGTASAAMSFHTNSEHKLVRHWLEHIRKAQKLYTEAKVKSQETSEFGGEGDGEEEGTGMIYLTSRSPRGGSSRASQLSSLVHSHSGSIEMNEASTISSRGVSFEQEFRGSSLSSDDGNANDPLGVSPKSRSFSQEASSGPLRPNSPRLDRRLFLSKSPTPNTLTVQIPIPNLSGQSLPNLTSASDSSPPTYSIHHHSLTVPKSLLSPTNRGVSYPPPSPRSLRRSHAVLQSRNPPLQKAKNIVSPEKLVEKCASLDVQVPEIRGVTPPSNDVSPVAPSPITSFNAKEASPTVANKSPDEASLPIAANPAATGLYPLESDDEVHIVHSNPASNESCDKLGCLDESGGSRRADGEVGVTTSISKRLARNERADTKRYHTAGAIDDIKRENNRDKDAAIHKRLSWNYGPQQQSHHHHPPGIHPDSMKTRQFFSCESMGSVRSSSGVSSTSSLLNCISHSDLETTPEGQELTARSTCRLPDVLPDVLIAVSEPDPDEPVSPQTDQVCECCESGRGCKSRSSSTSDVAVDPVATPSPAPPLCSSCPGQDDAIGSASSCPSSPKPVTSRKVSTGSSGGGVIIMKDFILTDASMEASEV